MPVTGWLGAVIPLVVAIFAAVAAYIFNIQLEKKRAFLKRTSDQLQYLYGPLKAITYASRMSWSAFIHHYGDQGTFFFFSDPVNPEQVKMWRNWVIHVFSPLHEKMEKIILDNTHLLEGDMPVEFGMLLAHIETYKSTISLWSDDNICDNDTVFRNTALVDFPTTLDERVSNDFDLLMRRQASLLASTQKTSWFHR